MTENPDDRNEWDVVVIGGGPPGENAADYAIKAGADFGRRLSAVIVEQELVGGECSYWACMPSKALLRPVELFDAAKRMPGLRTYVDGRDLDAAAVLERRDGFAAHDDSGQVEWARGAGIEVIRGSGRLAGERVVAVTAGDGSVRTISARHAVVLATGTRAMVPPISGLRESMPWISRDVTNMHEVPRRVLVIGGGVVACESATWLRGLGVAEVTVVEHNKRLLAREEPFAGEMIAAQLGEAGINVLLGTAIDRVQRNEPRSTGEGHVHGGEVTAWFADGTTVTADEILVAAGRTPNSDGIGLESVGISPNQRGFVEVDEHLRVAGHSWLYAVGDLCGKALLTHMGKYQARIAGAVIGATAGGQPLDGTEYIDLADAGAVPQVTFTDPEVGSVGLTESEARSKGVDIETVEYDLGAVAGARLLRDGYVGRAKLVIDRSADVMVGATFVGSGIAELVHSATVAVLGRVPMSLLWHAVPSYPTVSEIWLRLLETLREQRAEASRNQPVP